MATQQFKDFAQKNNLRPHSFIRDIFYDKNVKFEIGEIEPGKYFYGPVSGTDHFRKEVFGLEELASRLYWFCGVKLNTCNHPPIPVID